MTEHRLILTSDVTGELAKWAVRQSPYAAPEGLTRAINDFAEQWPSEDDFASFMPAAHWTESDLHEAVTNACLTIPSIVAWNEPKNSHRASMMFCSRYDKPNPDDDFIDLHALANNIARSAWEQER